MATMARVRRLQILPLLLGASLAAPAALAEDADSNTSTTLNAVVGTGDTVAVTRWSGAKVTGRVMEATACSLVVRTAGKSMAIPTAAIKTLRRYPRRNQGPDPKAMLAVAANGDGIGCAPETVALVGIAALVRGIHGLGRQPETVYRGTRGQPPAAACAAPAAARVKR